MDTTHQNGIDDDDDDDDDDDGGDGDGDGDDLDSLYAPASAIPHCSGRWSKLLLSEPPWTNKAEQQLYSMASQHGWQLNINCPGGLDIHCHQGNTIKSGVEKKTSFCI